MARNRQLMASISSIGLLLAFVLTLGYIPTASAKGAELAGTATTQATETPNQAVIDVVATPEGLDRFVVTWKTRKASRGEVLFGESPDTLTTRLADDHGGIPAKQHRALIQGVRTGTVYYFVILADDKQYDNNGTAFKVRTNVAKESPGDADRAAVAQNDQPISAQRKDDRDHPTDLVVKVGETDFSVEWQTRKAKAGWITYGQSIDQMMLRADDERGGSTIDHQHRVKVENLVPGSVYYFTLVVDGISYDNGGAAYKVRVGPAAVTEAVSPSRAIPEISGVQEPSPSIASLAAIGGSPFVYPTAGFMGEPFTSAHNGLDIWTSDPNQASCGNEVRAAFPGKVKRIWKSTTYDGSNWAGAPRGDVNAAIVVLEHTEPVPGLPSPFYTYYLHMAKDAGGTTRGPAAATCVYLSTWDKLASGEQIPAGFPLGQQGDLRLAGDRITHLHFSIATSDSGIAGPVNPAPYLGLSSLQRGNALLYSGQTINLRLSTNTEQDTIYFNADQGQVATLRMNRLNTTLDGYLYLYAPNGALVAQDDDSGGNFNPLINRVTLPQTGRYRIVASSWGGGSSGAYSLALTLETNNTTTCSPGANGVVLYEHGNYAGRCVTLTGDQVDFTTSNFNDMASSLRFVGSYASGWEAVLYEHTYYGGVSSTFRASDADLGNDTIGHDRASSMRIRQIDTDDGRTIGSGQTLSGQINPATDQDTYYFDASQGQLATLRMTRQTTTLDGYLYLYAPNGALVAQDDDSGGNFNPLINRVTLPQTGRYRIVASSWGGGSSGAYSLALTLETNNTTTCSPGANGVVLYEHGNYAGRCVTLTGDQVDFTTSNFNDMASSLRFVGSYASGWEAVLYEHTYYGGVSSTFRASDADLGNDTIGHDRASSVRIRQVTSEVVVDEQNTGFTKGGSYWQDDYTRGYNNHMYWTCVNGNVVDSWGEWRPNLPSARSYELFAFVPDYHTNTTNARYEIHHANGVSTVSRAQRTYSNVWVSLGTFNFSVGTAGYVRLTDATGEVASCNTQIGFDAIKWVPR